MCNQLEPASLSGINLIIVIVIRMFSLFEKAAMPLLMGLSAWYWFEPFLMALDLT